MTFNLSALHPDKDANKYTRGKLFVLAGSAQYPGAAVLAACASQRMGAGYTEVFTAREAVNIVRMAQASLVAHPFDEWDPKKLPTFSDRKPYAICVGPGFVSDAGSSDLVTPILKWAACPVLVDGGGLAHLNSPKALKRLAKRADCGFPTVITPHGGEAARLAKPLGIPTDNPEKLASELSAALHAIVMLKGPDTFIANGEQTETMHEGTPALAKAGTGDVLAGMTAALLAQGVDPFEAACASATLHARAGVAAAVRYTDIAVIAEDVIEAIPEVLKS